MGEPQNFGLQKIKSDNSDNVLFIFFLFQMNYGKYLVAFVPAAIFLVLIPFVNIYSLNYICPATDVLSPHSFTSQALIKCTAVGQVVNQHNKRSPCHALKKKSQETFLYEMF